MGHPTILSFMQEINEQAQRETIVARQSTRVIPAKTTAKVYPESFYSNSREPINNPDVNSSRDNATNNCCTTRVISAKTTAKVYPESFYSNSREPLNKPEVKSPEDNAANNCCTIL